MFESLALLISDAHQALGHPDRKYLDSEDLVRAALEALAFFGLDNQTGAYTRTSRRTPFYPTSRDFLITNVAPELATVTYVERKVRQAPYEQWEWVPMVRPAYLSDAIDSGLARASLIREEAGLRLQFSYNPLNTQHRLVYYEDPVAAQTLESRLGLPTRFGFMFANKTLVNAVPIMLMRSANLPEDEQMNAAQLQALSAVLAHAQSELKEYKPLWDQDKHDDPNTRGRMRHSLLGGYIDN